MKKQCKIAACLLMSTALCQTMVYADENTVKKDETVYAILDSDGSAAEEIVSGWIHQDGGVQNVQETLAISDVENVKTEEEPSVSGNVYTWNSENSDIYYKGTTQKELPVDVKITYELDGKLLSGEELIGKSGHLRMHITLTNNETITKVMHGKPIVLHPVYGVAGVIPLSTDVFTDVTCTSGRILSEGNHDIVAFTALPGLQETLDSAGLGSLNLGLKDDLVLEGEVQNFELSPIMMTMTANLPLDEIQEVSSLADLQNGIEQIENATAELLEGSGLLGDAQSLFTDNMKQLVSGADEIKDGINQTKAGVEEMAASVHESLPVLEEGVDGLRKGAALLDENLKTASSGSQMVSLGIQTLVQSMNTLINSDTNGLKAIRTALTDMDSALTQMQDVNAAKDAQIQNMQILLTSMKDHLDSSAESTMLKTQAEQVLASLSTQTINDTNLVPSTYKDLQLVLNKQITGMQTAVQQLGAILDGVIDSFNDPSGEQQRQLEELTQGARGLESGLQDLSAGAADLHSGMDTFKEKSGNLNALSAGVTQVSAAMSKLQTGSNVLSSGAVQLHDASVLLSGKTRELAEGMQTFQRDGIQQLSEKASLGIDELQLLMDIKDEIMKLNEQHATFSGAPENSEQTVKFIYKTNDLKISK